MGASGTVAFLEFLLTAAGAGVIAPDVFQGIARRLLVSMVAVRAMHVTVVMVMVMVMVMLGVVAIGAVYVGLLVHVRLLGNEIAGDYLAITRHVHVAAEQQTGFYLAFEAIANRLFRSLEQFDDLPQVPPEVGAHRDIEHMVAMGWNREPGIGLAFRQFHLVEVHPVIQAPHRQAHAVGVVDAKTQDEVLLQ
jgi:hypothetical protein